MFLLDTNVLSAMMSRAGAPEVLAWLAGQPADLLFTASVCQAEILAGVAIMPAGRRRQDVEGAALALFREDFEGRVLAFDAPAAIGYAAIFAARRRAGRPGTTADLMIAAIARCHDATLVTRNVADFDGCGVAIVNPWDGPA